MRAREPNSWPIRCHRTWTRELAVSCPSTILHVGGGRSSPRNFWCFWYDELLEQPSEYLWQTVRHRSRHSCCACKSGVRWKGFFRVRRNRMTKSLQRWAWLKLNITVIKTYRRQRHQQDSPLVCHLQCRRLHRARGHVLPFSQIAGNGGVAPDPIPGLFPIPLDQTEGRPSFR